MHFPFPDEMDRVLRALGPVLGEAVIVGGWAHRLHAEHPLATPSFEPLTTTDCDVALPLELVAPDGADLEERLQQQGFHLQLGGGEGGEHRRYVLQDHPEFYVQFLTRRSGDGLGPRGIELGGVLAEPLRFMDLQLASPWQAPLELSNGQTVTALVARPLAFLIGKLLVSDESTRNASGRAKDLLYVIDTLRLFEDSLDELRDEATHVRAVLSDRQLRRVRRSLRNHLEGPGSDALHGAAEIASATGGGRPQDAGEMQVILSYGILTFWGRDLLPNG